jgi:hypothetical protein
MPDGLLVVSTGSDARSSSADCSGRAPTAVVAFVVTPARHDVRMTRQLRLLDPSTVDWRLDEHTRAVGRQGVARARAALQAVLAARLAREAEAAEQSVAAPAPAPARPHAA